MFPLLKIINGDPRHSDHRPIIAELNMEAAPRTDYPSTSTFWFEAAWLQEEDCAQIVKEAWNSAFDFEGARVSDALAKVGRNLWQWDKEVLGALKKRIKVAKKELERCRRESISQEGVNREQMLRFKLNRLEDQHNLYWQQRAHANWLKFGDRNTTYFHAFASERKRTNVIKKLKREGGGVVEGEELGPFITNHYKSSFMSSARPENDELLCHVPSTVTNGMNNMLTREFSGNEVKEALDSIGDPKALGPDGTPAIFL
jgi:hypothetical protein